MTFEDRKVEPAAKFVLTSASLTLTNITNAADAQVGVDADLTINEQ